MKPEKNLFNAIVLGSLIIGLFIAVPQFLAKSPKSYNKTETYLISDKNSNSCSNNNENCVIKGNISSNGDKIYHVPGGSFYEKTQINKDTGERYFCSEEEAISAGWRKSKR